MNDVKVDIQYPIQFERISEFNVGDARFIKVKIWLMHTGENKNGSYFSKDVVEKAIPTLANTPILGFIEDNRDGEEDFSNHRSTLEKEDGKLVFKYNGSAYGVIPESNKAQWETRICEDGIEREFLTCEGLVWTKWDAPVDILNRDQVKSQSMELHKDYKGVYDNKSKLFHFTEFKFFGACFLGSDYNPAMTDSTIEMVDFSTQFEQVKSQFKEEITKMVTAFEQFEATQRQENDNSSVSIEGGNTVEEKLQLLAKFNFTRESVEAKGIDFEAIGMDELEAKLTEFAAEANPATTTDPQNTDFALTTGQLRSELDRALNPNPELNQWGWPVYKYYYVDSTSDTVIAYRVDDWRLVGFSYMLEGDKPSIDFTSEKPFKVVYQPMEGFGEEKETIMPVKYAEYLKEVAVKTAESEFTAKNEEAMNEMKSNYDTLKASHDVLTTEVTELREFKASALATERKQAEDALFAEFSDQLSDEEMAPVRNKTSEFSIDDLRIHLFALVGMKTHKPAVNFSAGKTEGTIRINVDGSSSGSQKKNTKPYAHLIEQTKASMK
jgi:hypothetical protein